jgi:hypothetical protein
MEVTGYLGKESLVPINYVDEWIPKLVLDVLTQKRI